MNTVWEGPKNSHEISMHTAGFTDIPYLTQFIDQNALIVTKMVVALAKNRMWRVDRNTPRIESFLCLLAAGS